MLAASLGVTRVSFTGMILAGDKSLSPVTVALELGRVEPVLAADDFASRFSFQLAPGVASHGDAEVGKSETVSRKRSTLLNVSLTLGSFRQPCLPGTRRSSKNSDAGLALVISRWSRARVQAT